MDTPLEAAESPPSCIVLDFQAMADAIRSRKINLRMFQARIACVNGHLQELRDELSRTFDSRVQMSRQERAVKADALAEKTLAWLAALQSLIEEARRLSASGSYDKVTPLILKLERIVDDLTEVVGEELERSTRAKRRAVFVRLSG